MFLLPRRTIQYHNANSTTPTPRSRNGTSASHNNHSRLKPTVSQAVSAILSMPLNIKRDSQCDICYEPYDSSQRTPASLACGHIFCFHCLGETQRFQHQPKCGVCRRPFYTFVKLHITLEKSSPAERLAEGLRTYSLKALDLDATDFTRARASRKLKEFLTLQPEHEFQDLRNILSALDSVAAAREKLRRMEEELSRARTAVPTLQNIRAARGDGARDGTRAGGGYRPQGSTSRHREERGELRERLDRPTTTAPTTQNFPTRIANFSSRNNGEIVYSDLGYSYA